MIKSSYVKTKKQYKVSFELPEERVGQKRDVRVLGNFNNWNWEEGVKLKSTKGNYTGSTELPAGEYQFRYLADGDHWVNDDEAHSYTDSGHGTTNSCFSLDEVKEEAKKPAAKKAPAKKTAPKKTASKDTKIEAAKSAPATKPVVTPEKKAAAKKPAAKKAEPKKSAVKKAATKKASQSDDLKKIEGIGPKIAGLLNEAGISSFDELAKASEKQIADVLQEAGARFRLAKHDTWQEQAKLAAAGKTDELKKLQDELKGGKR